MRGARLLLDTHVFLWWRADDRRVRPPAREVIAAADMVFVSAASAWEAAIKVALGRLKIPDTVEAGVLASGFERLPITFAHAEAAGRLPLHHADSFDRMLIAQARIEGLTLMTHDRQFEPYGLQVMWV
jgi:PIN domain nuclease of toxin-antitoxin system